MQRARSMSSVRVRIPRERDVLEDLMGSMKKYQIITTLSCYFVEFFIAWNVMSHGIMVPDNTPIYCKGTNYSIEDVMSQELLKLLRDEACSSNCKEVIVSTKYYDNTIVHQYHLYCDRKFFTTLAQFIFMGGVFIGNFLFGMLAGVWGRKIPLVIAILGQPFLGIGVAFSPNVYCYLVFKFLLSVFVGGTMTNCFILYSELVGVKWRPLVGVLTQIPFALGHLTLAGLAYVHRDWRYFQLTISLSALVLVHYIWTLPESPSWLLSVGKLERGIKQVEYIAKVNKMPTENIRSVILADVERKQKRRVVLRAAKCTDLCSEVFIRVISITSCINWFSNMCCYFGIAQYVGSLGSNLYLNFALTALIQQPSVLFLLYTLSSWGRKWSLMFSNSMAAVSALCILFVSKEELKIIPASFGMFALGMGYPTIFVYTVELFPTVIRSIGMGCSSSVGSIGAMLAAFVADLNREVIWLPPVIFSVLMAIATVTVIFMPETKNKVLPASMQDIDALMSRNNFWQKRRRSTLI